MHGEKHSSMGISKMMKSKVAKMAHAGKDIGKKGKKFAEIAAKAGKKFGKERGKKIAAAVMWKNVKKG